MHKQRTRVALLVTILAVVTLTATCVVLALLYQHSLGLWRRNLLDLVKIRKAIIDHAYQTTGDEAKTLQILNAAQREAPDIGSTGEFTVARLEAGRVHFLVGLRYSGVTSVPYGEDLAEPMHRALAGGIGTLVGRDYRGVKVLAAYRNVDSLPWGLVAKVDLSEVRRPFVRAFGIALAVAALLIGFGSALFVRITGPMIHAVAESEARFRAIFEQSSVGKTLTAPDGHLLALNQAFAQMLGYSLKELKDADFAELTHPDDLEASRECVRCLLAGEHESYRLEKRYLSKNGEAVWTDVNTTLLRDAREDPLYFITVIVDISARRLAEEELAALNAELEERVRARTRELEEADDRLRLVIGATPAVIYSLRPEEGFEATYVDGNVSELLGVHAEEITESPQSWVEHVHSEDRDRVLESFASLFEKGRKTLEYRIRHAAGHELWILDESRLIRDEDGSPRAIVGTWVDITARRRNEERISALNQELADAVEQLEAINRELESFTYTVSHDLRAPLRAIDGFSRLLIEEHGSSFSGEAARYLGIVRDSTRNMGQLIDDLLSFSRISRQSMRREPVDLDALVDEVWNELEMERAGRRIEFAHQPLFAVSGDRGLLRLVFVNLLGNAIKFTGKREVARIEVGASAENGDKVCYVCDNGAGFDMRYKDKLFGVFQRLHPAAEFEGTGVGLATVARVVHRHGGKIWAEGEPGRGATFYLTFEGGADDPDRSG